MVWFLALRDRVRSSLWFIPSIFVFVAVLLALGLVALDRALAVDRPDLFFMFGGSPEGARSVLSAIAQSMLTFTGLVFTITMLVLQLASTQLSPRVTRTFLRDRGNQVVLGQFVATFVFTLLVLREVRTAVDGSDPFVPGVSVWVAFALLLASVAAFIWYIDHMAHAIRAGTVIRNIWQETREAIERLYPERVGSPAAAEALPDLGPPDRVLPAPATGVLVAVDIDAVLSVTEAPGRVLELQAAVGDFLVEGEPLVRLWGDWDRAAIDRARGALALAGERTLEQDAAFGLRQLVDVALRALSPGTNDPTTAVQAIDRIHDLLRRLAEREIPAAARLADGRLRAILPRPGWDDLVRLSVDEIRLAGEGQLQVARRLRSLLEDLASVAPAARQPIIRMEQVELQATRERGFRGRFDRQAAAAPSVRGHAMSQSGGRSPMPIPPRSTDVRS